MADDLLTQLGSIVGIGVGSLELELIKHWFAPGDAIHGRVTLRPKNKTEAKRLVAAVEATEERTSWVSDARGGRTLRRETARVYRYEQQLEGKRTYHEEAYDLHLPLPAESPPPSGTLGDVARLISIVARVVRGPILWRVHAFLDIPWKANIKTRVDISVG